MRKSTTAAQTDAAKVHLLPGVKLTPEGVRKALIVNPQRGSRLVEVGFDSPDPKVAAAVVNEVVDAYLELRMEEAKRSADWLQRQLTGAQTRLVEAERRLQTYVRVHGLEVLETGKGEAAELVNGRLQALHQSLTQAQADRIQKQSAEEQAVRQASARDLDSPVVQNLTVRLTDLRREHAKLASVFHEEYPSVKAVQSQIAELEQAIDREIGLVVSRGQREYRAAARREALIRQALNEENARVQGLAKSGDATEGYESLKRDVVTNQGQVSVLNQKLKEVSISAALKAANVGVVDRADPPTAPYGTPLTISVGLAMVVGLVLAVGGAFLQEHFDTSMRTVEDVDVYLGVPTLAAIPAAGSEVRLLGRVESHGDWRRIGQQAPRQSPLGEAFAALRTAVLLRDDGAATRSLLITSAQPEEGKTTISINLALSLARLNHRVLLVDANMRSPSVNQALGLPASPGLVDYLTTDTDWRACVHEQARANLDVLVGGRPDASPADLLSLPRMRSLVTDASRDYAFVVIDSPALLTHPADVQSLARLTDTVLLAVRQGATPREVVASAISQLDHVSGVVLNRLDRRDIFVPRQDVAAASA